MRAAALKAAADMQAELDSRAARLRELQAAQEKLQVRVAACTHMQFGGINLVADMPPLLPPHVLRFRNGWLMHSAMLSVCRRVRRTA